MKTLEICQKQPFDIIAMTPRGTLGLCCVHIAQLMTHPAIYTTPFTLQLCCKPLGILQRVTQSQKVDISSHDVLQELNNIDFAWYRSQDFLKEEVEKPEFPAFHMKAFENNQKFFSSNLIIYSPYWMRSRREVELPISRYIVDIPGTMKTFKSS